MSCFDGMKDRKVSSERWRSARETSRQRNEEELRKVLLGGAFWEMLSLVDAHETFPIREIDPVQFDIHPMTARLVQFLPSRFASDAP